MYYEPSVCRETNCWYFVKVYTQTYTEKLKKTTDGESATEVSGDEYTNVKHWVKYCPK